MSAPSRYEAGAWPHDVDDLTLHLDRRHVDPGVLRILAAAVRASRLGPDEITAIALPDESRPDARYVEITHAPNRPITRTCLPVEYVLAEMRRGAPL